MKSKKYTGAAILHSYHRKLISPLHHAEHLTQSHQKKEAGCGCQENFSSAYHVSLDNMRVSCEFENIKFEDWEVCIYDKIIKDVARKLIAMGDDNDISLHKSANQLISQFSNDSLKEAS